MFFLGSLWYIDDRSVRMAWLVVTDEILHESVREGKKREKKIQEEEGKGAEGVI